VTSRVLSFVEFLRTSPDATVSSVGFCKRQKVNVKKVFKN